MPIGFPVSPADNDPHPTVDPVWRYNAAAAAWLPIPGAAGSTPVTARLTSLVGTDDFIGFRTISGEPVPHLVSASVMDTFMGGSGGPTGPAAFTSGQWDATPIAGGLRFSFPTDLPNDGGSALTALQYSVNSGSTWTTFSGGVTQVDRDVTGLPATPQGCMVRAVNAIDNGPNSDLKTRTPLAGGVTYIDFATLSGMSEAANGGGGSDYTGTAADGYAIGSDYSIADEASGGWKVQISGATGSALPLVGLYSINTVGAWDGNVFAIVYPPAGVGSEYECTRGVADGYADLTGGTVVTHQDNDWVRFRVTDEDLVVDIARAATPTTWIPLATANIVHATALYPRCTSFGAAGCEFIQPQVVP